MADRSLIDALEAALGSAEPEKRVAVLDHVADLFLAGANRYSDEQIALFDEVFFKLTVDIEVKARRSLARRLAPVGRAPKKTMQWLARDPSAAVAAPVLRHVLQLQDSDIVAVASTGSQRHLYALAHRSALSETVTDILVDRGCRRVARSLATNAGAKLSDRGFGKLVERAGSDDILAHAIGTRRDVPRRHFVRLLLTASASVRVKLASAVPFAGRDVEGVVAEIVGHISRDARIVSQDPDVAKAEIDRLCRTDMSSEVDTRAAARARKFDQTVLALSFLCRIPFEVAECALTADKPESVLILTKAAGCSWNTTKSLLLIQSHGRCLSTEELKRARDDFDRLQLTTATGVLKRYRLRQHGEEGRPPDYGEACGKAPAA